MTTEISVMYGSEKVNRRPGVYGSPWDLVAIRISAWGFNHNHNHANIAYVCVEEITGDFED